MARFIFEPIKVNSKGPHGECVLRTFEDIGAFMLLRLKAEQRQSPAWKGVRLDLIQARFGARQAEVHAATRAALAAEGWLEDS